jgi:hypothetical protein
MHEYAEALQAAGAAVHVFEQFGGEDGPWWAHVTYAGKTGWVTGWTSSSPEVDAFLAEFGWDQEPSLHRLAELGTRLLTNVISQQTAERVTSEAARFVRTAGKSLAAPSSSVLR